MPMKDNSKKGKGKDNKVVRAIKKTDMTIEEDTGETKLVITVFGGKGVGKTTTAMQFPGSVAAISLDRKTKRIADQRNEAGSKKDIRVYDGRKYLIIDRDNYTKTSANTIEYLHGILEHLDSDEDNRPDWIILDAMEYMIQICEGKMRYDNHIGPYEAFGKNPALWRERNTNFRIWHDQAMKVARRGVIYTAYYAYDSNENSEYKIPKWTEVVQSESDIVVHCSARPVEGEEFAVNHGTQVLSSKIPSMLQTGMAYDMHENVFEKDLQEYYMPRKG